MRRKNRFFVVTNVCGAFAAVVALVLIGANPSTATPTTSHKHLTPLQRGLEFYKGKTVTLVADAAPGNPPDMWALLIAPIMSSYLHANVVVDADGGAGGVPAQDLMAASPATGLVFGELNFIGDLDNLLTDAPGLNFNPERIPFLASIPTSSPGSVMISAPTSPFINFKTVEAAKNGVSIMTTVTGGSNIVLRAMDGVLRLPVTYVSYSTVALLATGFIRGDEPLAFTSTTSLVSEITGGSARPILMSGPPSSSLSPQLQTALRGVPTIAQILAKYAPKGKQAQRAVTALASFVNYPSIAFGVPTRTPADEVAALRAALKIAIKNKANQAALGAVDGGSGYLSGDQAKALYLTAANNLHLLAPFVPKV